MIISKVWKKLQVHLIKSSTQNSICVKANIKGFKTYILKTNIDLDLLRYKHAIYIDNLVLKITPNIPCMHGPLCLKCYTVSIPYFKYFFKIQFRKSITPLSEIDFHFVSCLFCVFQNSIFTQGSRFPPFQKSISLTKF